MKPVKMIANSQASLAECLGCAGRLWREHKYMKMTLTFGRDRSLEQNRLVHKWFTEIADQRGEHTADEVKIICKRKFFIPILRGEDEAFNDAFLAIWLSPNTDYPKLRQGLIGNNR